jgi:hypothetical protein
MHETALRTVLLIRAIDESDQAGEVLSLAERAEATKQAAQSAGEIPNGLAGASLPAAAERLLIKRADLLLDKLVARSPVIARVIGSAGGTRWLTATLLALSFGVGVSMSALDGSQRIDVLSISLHALIAWNLAVYAMLIANTLKPHKRPTTPAEPSASWMSVLYERAVRERTEQLLKQSSQYNMPLAQALRRFTLEWSAIVRPALVLRAKRLFHVGAAVLAFGLITGLYVRGLILRYDAGWESTFLDAGEVRTWLGLLYGPASFLSGIALPSASELETLRWGAGPRSAPAANWIHLIALTAGAFIVVPRLVAALVNTLALWQLRRKPPTPATFLPYARTVLLETGRVRGLKASVVTYAYQPTRDALAGLKVLLVDALGAEVDVEVRADVAYGDEDAFTTRTPARGERVEHDWLAPADCYVLLMSAAATPETENHGLLIGALRRRLSQRAASFLVVVDTSAYAARMGADPSFAGRLAERARSWQEFCSAQGQTACVIELSRLRGGEAPDATARKHVREALQPAAGT